MLVHKIEATGVVQHVMFRQFLQECESVRRFKEIPQATSPSCLSALGDKRSVIRLFGMFVL